jgi:hypothetical protein
VRGFEALLAKLIPLPDGAPAIVVGLAGDFPDARDVDLAGGIAMRRKNRRADWRGAR